MENLNTYKISNNPFETFLTWFEEAKKIDDNAEAFALATASKDALPSVRYLLYKGLVDEKFRFFTNYDSDKARDLDSNPFGSMAFFWRNSARQVRVEGEVVRTSREVSKEYFASRDRESQIASSVSSQSSEINSRNELLENYEKFLTNVGENDVPCPENWGGYFLKPTKIEFFIYGEHRLNDRFSFSLKDDGSWKISRLQP